MNTPACAHCGRPIDLSGDAWRLLPGNRYEHLACPISAEMKTLPPSGSPRLGGGSGREKAPAALPDDGRGGGLPARLQKHDPQQDQGGRASRQAAQGRPDRPGRSPGRAGAAGRLHGPRVTLLTLAPRGEGRSLATGGGLRPAGPASPSAAPVHLGTRLVLRQRLRLDQLAPDRRTKGSRPSRVALRMALTVTPIWAAASSMVSRFSVSMARVYRRKKALSRC